jgi:hypothetical protein
MLERGGLIEKQENNLGTNKYLVMSTDSARNQGQLY